MEILLQSAYNDLPAYLIEFQIDSLNNFEKLTEM